MGRGDVYPLPHVRPRSTAPAAFCGDERIALVMTPRVLLGLCADFKQLGRGLLDTVAALRGHQTPEKICHATIRVALLCNWRPLDAELANSIQGTTSFYPSTSKKPLT